MFASGSLSPRGTSPQSAASKKSHGSSKASARSNRTSPDERGRRTGELKITIDVLHAAKLKDGNKSAPSSPKGHESKVEPSKIARSHHVRHKWELFKKEPVVTKQGHTKKSPRKGASPRSRDREDIKDEASRSNKSGRSRRVTDEIAIKAKKAHVSPRQSVHEKSLESSSL